MKKVNWQYKNSDYNALDETIKFCEQIIIQLGGKIVAEHITKRVYKFRDGYVSVSKIYFPQKPFLVLEFADMIDGPYEDADPFPFDLTIEEIQLEIQYALGVLPYPEWKECAIAENLISKYANLLVWNDKYVIYNEYEDAFLLDVQNKETYYLGDYYGDPELAMIDKQERFAVVIAGHCLGVFDMNNKQLQLRDINVTEWIISLNQEGRKIEVICEGGKRYIYEV